MSVLNIQDIGDKAWSMVHPLLELSAEKPMHTDWTSSLNLRDEFFPSEEDTFLGRINGNGYIQWGLEDHDLVVIDCKKQPADHQLVLLYWNERFSVARYFRSGLEEFIVLRDGQDPIRVPKALDFRIWGVISGLMRQL